MKALNIEHVPYTTVKLKKEPFSLCDCFVNTENELIHASEIAVHYSGESRFVDQSLFELMRTACEKEGITGYQDFINRLLTVDYIINNEDRHLNNFGFLRNPETLEWISPAPVYDSGLSLFHNTLTELIDEKEILVAKPFFNDHKRQIGLVTDFTWLDDRKLKSIPDLLHSTLSSYYSRLGLSTNLEVRTDRIAEYARQRIKNLEKTANIQRSPVSRKKPGQALAGSSKGL
jgi:hypothetical protein